MAAYALNRPAPRAAKFPAPPVSKAPAPVRLEVKALRATVTFRASALPPDYPANGPAPAVRLRVRLERGGVVTAEVSGKAMRRALAQLRPRLAAGEDPTVVLRGTLGADRVLTEAGLTVAEARP
jgi:hypothetical protein